MDLKTDASIRQAVHREMAAAFARLDAAPSRHDAIMRAIRQAEPQRKRRLTPVLAVALTLLCGAALASGLGVFGRFVSSVEDESAAARLSLLDGAALSIEKTVRLRVPETDAGTAPATLRGQILAAQRGRAYDLTVHQVYCDGRKLYYAYTLRTAGAPLSTYAGEATGFDPWDQSFPGDRFDDVFGPDFDAAQREEANRWLDAHARGSVVVHGAYMGDGAELADGTALSPIDSDVQTPDAHTTVGYFEVALPQALADGETFTFMLRVVPADTVYYQDETGVYRSVVVDRDAALTVPVAAQVTGASHVRTGEGSADGYPAHAELTISDVDMVCTVRIEAPQDYMPEGYTLLADGRTLSCNDFYTQFDGQAHTLHMRWDLPASMESLTLVPLDPAYADEAIPLTP